MFYVVFFALLSLTLTPIVNAVLCANNCNFASNLNNPTPPTCTYVDKPVSEHSCQVVLTIDYNSGAVNGTLNSKIPPTSPNFDGVTVFSLAREAANLTIEFDCSDTDKCDFTFVDNLLKSDWSKLLNQLKPLRNVLVDMLIDSTTLDSNATCPARQPCSGTGFCRMVYQVWSDTVGPVYTSECSNATDQPLLDWVQALDQIKVGEFLVYTCNKPGCADVSVAANIIKIMNRDYILPFNVIIPPTTTPNMPTTVSAANFILFEKTLMGILIFTSLRFFYLF